MAASPLGTLLIQRLDSALGTALSQQTRLASRAGIDIITQPGEADKPDQVTNKLVRHQRETVDRAATQLRPHGQDAVNKASTRTNIGAAGNLAGAPTPSATTTLGNAARIILNLLANHTTGSNAIQGRAPLINTPPSANLGPQIANTLSQTIQQSGLFYESHLKALSQGQLKLSDLQMQPQNTTTSGLKAATLTSQTAQTTNPAQANLSATQSPQQATQPPTQQIAQQATQQTANINQQTSNVNQAAQQTLQTTISAQNPTPGVDQSTHGIVRMQLEALADQSVQWRGEAWHGAEMEWRIQRHDDHDEEPNRPEASKMRWNSSLNLNLPMLGNIQANIGIGGKNVYLELEVSEEKLWLLQTHTKQLAQQLEARQLQLASLKIENKTDTTKVDS